MRRFCIIFLLIISSARLVSAQPTAANVDSIYVGRVPKAVLETFCKLAPRSTDITYWAQRQTNNPYGTALEYVFEFSLVSSITGTRVFGDAFFTSTGRIIEYNIPIPLDSLPVSVSQILLNTIRKKRYSHLDARAGLITEVGRRGEVIYIAKYLNKLFKGCSGWFEYTIVIDSMGRVKTQTERCF